MQIAVICNEVQKAELMSGDLEESAVRWTSEIADITNGDAIIDLTFQNTPERLAALKRFPLVVINSVADTVNSIDPSFIRINGWTTFLKGAIMEAAGAESVRATAEEVFAQFAKKVEWLPDEPGFVTPRVISMMINEAYFALSEGVSTKEEIDTAMKLGTAYPFGPFAWSQQIGLKNIARLLTTLGTKEPRYQPCPLLVQEAAI
ncbi:MAG: hypothetical protein JWP69_351 [Flaviaesturariibacter sp.]|nr:hypothetical protein [Flaviaesturariibacter sp.]